MNIDWKKLIRPLSVYKWKLQSYNKDKTKAIIVPYFDARDLEERLDEVLTPEGWQDDYKQVKNTLFGGIGIKTDEGWLWKWGAGVEAGVTSETKIKGEESDAFKRAGVKWGIFRDVYKVGQIWLNARPGGKYADLLDHNGKVIPSYKLNEYIHKNYAESNGRMKFIGKNQTQETDKSGLPVNYIAVKLKHPQPSI